MSVCRCVWSLSRVLVKKSWLNWCQYRIQVLTICIAPGFLLCAGRKQKSKSTTKIKKKKLMKTCHIGLYQILACSWFYSKNFLLFISFCLPATINELDRQSWGVTVSGWADARCNTHLFQVSLYMKRIISEIYITYSFLLYLLLKTMTLSLFYLLIFQLVLYTFCKEYYIKIQCWIRLQNRV